MDSYYLLVTNRYFFGGRLGFRVSPNRPNWFLYNRRDDLFVHCIQLKK